MGIQQTRSQFRRSWILSLAAALIGVLAFAGFSATGGASQTQADTAMDAEELAFMVLINDYRAQNGRGPLIIDQSLQAAADWMSTDMGEENYFAHNDSLGRTPWTRMCDFNYCHNTWKGENIAAGYTTGADVFEGWRNSPGHNSNMLGENYTVMGIARVRTPGSTYGWYWTNDFGGQIIDASPPPAPTNTPSATPSPSPTASPTPSPSPAASPSPSPTPTPVPATPKPTPSPTTTLRPEETAADLDCDTLITGLDSLTLLRFLSGFNGYDGSCAPIGSMASAQGGGGPRARGDVDCTGTVTSGDALGILRYTAGETSAIHLSC